MMPVHGTSVDVALKAIRRSGAGIVRRHEVRHLDRACRIGRCINHIHLVRCAVRPAIRDRAIEPDAKARGVHHHPPRRDMPDDAARRARRSAAARAATTAGGRRRTATATCARRPAAERPAARSATAGKYRRTRWRDVGRGCRALQRFETTSASAALKRYKVPCGRWADSTASSAAREMIAENDQMAPRLEILHTLR